ncbi:MAG: protein translocase subunit SecF [Fusobacteriaceae bacterium]|nr:protein translocase subunit SecF [Fusobacteriaceae bacterium]MBP6467705.1 protein translocase subunit SecF [Fusobacteriaceae bacterium]
MRVQIIGKSKLWLGISIVLVVLSLISIMTKSLNLGIDFTGGSLFEIKFEKPVTLQEINPTLDEIGKSIPQFSANSRIAQVDEKGILILRTQAIDETQKGTVLEGLKNYSKYEVLKSEKVGATVGKELLNSAILSLILGSLLIIAYISFRFELKFALGGVIALVHDIIIAIGVIALLGYEINSSFIAAILTILGYSINDTIVVYDRIRENLKRHKGLSLENIIDNSVNDVMRRSLNTSFTTLLAVLAVLIFGGDTLKSFMVTLLVGIGIGTYSSIFVASPVVYLLEGKLKSKIKL